LNLEPMWDHPRLKVWTAFGPNCWNTKFTAHWNCQLHRQ
jgi:hypothetical protein